MGTRSRSRIIVVSVAAVLIAALLLWRGVAMALFDTGKAVQIDPNAIEDSTLIIGTHLIYLHSLNEHIYSIAVQSASDSGQYKRYYKSELAGGLWMDITDAGSINDISAGGTVADLNEIRNLYMTHHTKSDGITYNLQTKQDICIFDIVYIYDLENMPELEPLKLQYDAMEDSDSKERTKKFWKTEVQTDRTKQYDKQLQALQEYYMELSANDAGSKYLETTLGVMEKVSNARKVEVFKTIDDALLNLQNDVSDINDTGSNALLTAIGDSQNKLSESMNDAKGNMLSEGTTAVSAKDYLLSTDMITNAEEQNYFACDKQNLQLQYLDNINNSRIVDAAEELKLLEELIERADIKYGIALSVGKTPEYDVLVARNASYAARENRMKADTAGAGTACGELEFLIQGTVDRKNSIDKKQAQEYILLKIQEAAKFKAVIKQDEYTQTYQASVDGYIQWLNKLLESIKESDSSSSSGEEKTIYEQKADLQEQKLKALDALDLDTAKRIDAKLEDVDEKISALENAQSEKLKDLTEKKSALEKQLRENPQDINIQVEISRVEAELAAGESGISGSSQAANIMESKNEILRLLGAGDTSDAVLGQISAHIDVLNTMLEDGSPLALAAMKEVYAKMLAKSELGTIGAYDQPQDDNAGEVAQSKNEILEILEGEDIDADAQKRLADKVNGLVSMLENGSSSSLSALTEIEETLKSKSEETDIYDDLTEKIENAIMENKDNVNLPENTTAQKNDAYDELLSTIENAVSESAVSTGLTGELTPERAGDLIAEALGIDSLINPDGSISNAAVSGLSNEELEAVLLALGDFCGETGFDSRIMALAQGLAANLEQSTNASVFHTKKEQEELYVPAETLAGCLGYRYVWNDTKRNAVLSKGRIFYSFTAYDKEVLTEKEETLQMERPAGFAGQLFIPGSFVQSQFDIYIYDISGTEYSVLVNDKVVEKSQEILASLLEKGGY